MPLVVFRINYPGEKNNFIVNTIYRLIDLKLDFIYKQEVNSQEGPILLGIVDMDAIELKQRMILIEEDHPLGRLLDIDVYNENFSQLTRIQFDKPKRKCLICDDFAHNCIRSKKHKIEVVEAKIFSMFRNYISKELAEIACSALQEELDLEGKPGLITPSSNGAHQDMDYDLMTESIKSLKNGFRNIAYLSFDSSIEKLRLEGLKIEEDMFKATNNVNTHKGAIFIMSTLIAGFVKSLINYSTWQRQIVDLMKDIMDDFNYENDSHGKEVYLKYGVTGIRGEAVKGFPLVFKQSEAGHKTLFRIMSECDDTNVLYRHNPKVLEKVKRDAKKVLADFRDKRIQALNDEYINMNISPGGSADLYAGVIFVKKIKQFMKAQ